MWNLDGMFVEGFYMGEFAVRGFVESSRVKYGGEVVHTVVLEKPLKIRWRADPAERVLLEHKYVTRVTDRR